MKFLLISPNLIESIFIPSSRLTRLSRLLFTRSLSAPTFTFSSSFSLKPAMGKEEKVSFSFSSKSSSSSRPNPSKRPQPFDPQDPTDSSSNQPQFVTVFDPSQTLDSAASPKLVIAPIPNSDFRSGGIKKMKNLSLPSADEQQQQQQQPGSTKFVVADADSSAPTDNISFGLTLRTNSTAAEAASKQEPDLTLKRYQEDMKNLPEDRGMDEFKDVPVEAFGAAILAGYGWSEGKGIGRNNKVDTKVVQYDRRAGTLGLGYQPSANDPIVKVKKGRDMVLKVNKNVEPLPRIVRIVSGVHLGKKGEVVKGLEGSELVLKLVGSGEEVRVDEEMVAELGSEAEERCLRKLKELEIHDRKEKRERRERDDKKDQGSDRRTSESRRRNSREKSPVRWLRSHIRVRVISKDFKGGKWYLKKGEVVDVVGPTTCDISMDGSRELVQGVDQEMLETVLPRRGGSVLVLYGRHKGVYGSLVERDMEEETGVVRDTDSHDLINVRLEQIAEYAGDPSYLGY